MITNDQFIDAVTSLVLNNTKPNADQCDCISHPLSPDLMIIAGPGTGKTTVLVLRALKHVIVDRVLPEEVVITTFTRKAASEIRSRLISWGIPLLEHFKQYAASQNMQDLAKHLAISDINAFVTGTLDSLCEQWIGRMRQQGEIPPVMIEGFAARQIYSRQVFGSIYRSNQAILDQYLSRYTWEQSPPGSQGEAVDTAKSLVDRLVQDQAHLDKYESAPGPDQQARCLLGNSLRELHAYMREQGQYDFALLEQEFLNKLGNPILAGKLPLLKVLLIDEYQDTNPLQESIYFKLADLFNCSVTVVGDDDQSLYRFRGATVELFRDFRARFSAIANRPIPDHKFLTLNYRSTSQIVDFFNSYIVNDANFIPARVTPPKPAIVAAGKNQVKNIPLLGMFRATANDLAEDVSKFLYDVFRSNGRAIPGTDIILKADSEGGDVGDAVFMAHSVNEFGRPYMGNPGKARLPWMLRDSLSQRGIRVFNPRGRALKDIPEVQQLLGLVAHCIDPNGHLLGNMSIFQQTRSEILNWMGIASVFIDSNPSPNRPHTLKDFVSAWQIGKPLNTSMKEWPREWPVLDLLYKLLTWLPQFQDLPEYQIYIEAITRSVTQATAFSAYQGRIMREAPYKQRSREAVIRDILAPIAENVVEVDEELLTHVPRDHLNVMTIHQSKGLEFPLVIVDIGAEFSRNHPKQKFKRFPEEPSNVALAEDDLANYSHAGKLRVSRNALDRTFEDLIRLYYVAYSRPQTALLLVGHTNLLQYKTNIRHLATFWRQDGSWAWKGQYAGKKPPASVTLPGIMEI
jgi:DNA helicase-2/ATP-dependent DNA helicase PcrA